MVTYTSRTIALVTTIVSVLLIVGGGVGAYLGSRSSSAGDQGAAPDWHLVFGVLPALVLSVVVYLVAHRMKRQGESGAGAN